MARNGGKMVIYESQILRLTLQKERRQIGTMTSPPLSTFMYVFLLLDSTLNEVEQDCEQFCI